MGHTVRPLRALMALFVTAQPPLRPPPPLPMDQETHFSSAGGYQSLSVDVPACNPAFWMDLDLHCR